MHTLGSPVTLSMICLVKVILIELAGDRTRAPLSLDEHITCVGLEIADVKPSSSQCHRNDNLNPT